MLHSEADLSRTHHTREERSAAASALLIIDGPAADHSALLSAFDSAYVLALNGSRAADPQRYLQVPTEAVGRVLLCRLRFLLGPERLGYVAAPLLLKHIWESESRAGSFVIAFPGFATERILSARHMLAGGAEAVLLRRDNAPALVFGIARNARNARMVAHWADRVEHFSVHPNDYDVDQLLGSNMVEYLCDKIASVRGESMPAAGTGEPLASPVMKLPSVVRDALIRLLPASDALKRDPEENFVRVLNSPAPDIKQEIGTAITELGASIWRMRPDLQSAFDLSRSTGRRGYSDWFLTHAAAEFGIGDEFLQPVRSERAKRSLAVFTRTPRIPRVVGDERVSDPWSGLNLVGYPHAEMGMGQQLRLCAEAAHASGLKCSILDFRYGIIASQQDTGYEHLVRSRHPYRINLFHINADQMPLVREKLGPDFFRDHYNIGYWEWELSEFPEAWRNSLDLVDEIWAPSRFIQQAIAKQTSKPVMWMPLPVHFPYPEDFDEAAVRNSFGVSENSFVFLFSFDLSSFATRKNFVGCIKAFQAAFPQSRRDVTLILKTIRHPHHDRQYWDVLRAAGEDPRICIIDRILRRRELAQLMAACDAFVSLHRSEGFGLGIAEAMSLGKPVIATNYSGNVDFTNADNSCVVDYKLIPVRPGEYVYPEGQQWADPDLDMAAAHMRMLAGNPEAGRLIGAAGREFVKRHHSPQLIGARYQNRIQQIASARRLLNGWDELDEPAARSVQQTTSDTSSARKSGQRRRFRFR